MPTYRNAFHFHVLLCCFLQLFLLASHELLLNQTISGTTTTTTFVTDDNLNFTDVPVEVPELCFMDFGLFKEPYPQPSGEGSTYDASLGQKLSRPIIVTLCRDGIAIDESDPFYATEVREDLTFTIKSVYLSSTNESMRLQDEITFCQHSANIYKMYEPQRYDSSPRFSRTYCTERNESGIHEIEGIPIIGESLIAQGLYHKLLTSMKGRGEIIRRKIVFAFTYGNVTRTIATIPINIFIRTVSLQWLHSPTELLANSPFDIELEIVDQLGKRIITGPDSTLNVEVTISYHSNIKYLSYRPGVEDFLYNTTMLLGGEETMVSLRNYDTVLHKRASEGIVSFHNVTFLDIMKGVILNATLTLPRTNIRQPDNYLDASDKCKVFSNQGYYTFIGDTCGTEMIVPGVVFSNPIHVKKQEANFIELVEMQKHDDQASATAHFSISWLWIEIKDEKGRRIYSGPDSVLEITAHTNPPVHIKKPTFRTYRGLGRFQGAVGEITSSVKFYFTTITGKNKELQTNESKTFTITGDVNLAMFANFNNNGGVSYPDPLSGTFATFAAADISNIYKMDLPYLQNFSINVQKVNTRNDVFITTNRYMELIERAERNPATGIKGIIGFGSYNLMLQMAGLIFIHEMPIISIRESHTDFVQSSLYPTVKVICSDDVVMAKNVAMWMKRHSWTKINLIASVKFLSEFKRGFANSNISIIYEVLVDEAPEAEWGKLESELAPKLQELSKSGSRIVFHYVLGPTQYLVLNLSMRYHIDQRNGYQWISTGNAAAMFPWDNEHDVCLGTPTCVDGMRGTILVSTSYNVQGYISKEWFGMHRRVFTMNRILNSGIPTSRSFAESGEIALAYDAVLVYSHALNMLVQSDAVISTKNLLKAMHNVNFTGLTGRIQFRDGGGRKGLIAQVIVVEESNFKYVPVNKFFIDRLIIFPETGKIKTNPAGSWKPEARKRLRLDNPLDLYNSQYEVSFASSAILAMAKMKTTLQERLILRFYISMAGYVIGKDLSITNRQIIIRSEFIKPQFLCVSGCGGQRAFMWNAHDYGHGFCTLADQCRCKLLAEVLNNVPENQRTKLAYSGDTCEVLICFCKHGQCVEPDKCICIPGWRGSLCTIPICRFRCIHGHCMAPNYCECDIGYHGSTCNILIGVAISIIMVCFVIFLIVFVFGYRWLRKRKQQRLALQNLDWLVYWEDVRSEEQIRQQQPSVVKTVVSSPASTFIDDFLQPALEHKLTFIKEPSVKNVVNVVYWNEKIAYAKVFPKRLSLDINSIPVRLEILELKELRHPHLVEFIGACLDYPNVALLLEYMPKGSLTDIINSEAYSLTWEFKYSILRDICKGMDYLHESKLGSHGRLKSANCLIDNRWTCKITGFGVPMFRRQEDFYIDPTETQETQKELLWTAPELLRLCIHIMEVGKGTKSADVYSFGIILAELCTHELPYTFELTMISMGELYRLLRNYHDPSTRGIKRLLQMHNYTLGRSMRPSIHDDAQLPDTYVEKKGLENLIDEATAEDPTVRPTFQEVQIKLNIIHPLKGELIENLIEMLERQTNHLEEIIGEKVREVQDEKKKIEELIARLMPPIIADQLKKKEDAMARTYNNVSVFFSDIVGFTAIAKQSKPMEVVQLLNDLYTCFDSIMEGFDVYKMETIGDAYCVVSGIPNPNPKHAEELAGMALHILSAVMTFPIHHMPNVQLRVRIGMHSGSCVAGVVGIKMPRFSMFGVDVVTAQQMESGGQENCIQVSDSMAKLLMRSERFNLKRRGEVELKNIGTMTTYWLIGMTGFNKILPKFDNLPGSSTHEMKAT